MSQSRWRHVFHNYTISIIVYYCTLSTEYVHGHCRVNKESVHIIGFSSAWCNPGGHEVLELTENFIVESLQKFTVDDLLGVGPNILEKLYVDSFDPGQF